MGNKKKLKSYIQDDRPLKVKSYVSSHKLCLRDITLGHRRNLLHYSAQYGTADMIRCLLKLECDPGQQDRYGNLPLHVALQRGLHEDIKQARDTLWEVVAALLDAYPLGQDVENREGVTGHDLLTSLKKRIRSASHTTSQEAAREAIDKKALDDMWKQKLSEEAIFEYEEGLPRYGCNDDIQQEETQQSHDDWFEKIRQDHAGKEHRGQHTFWRDKKRKSEDTTGEPSSKRSNKQQSTEEKLQAAREEMKKRFKPMPVHSSLDRLLSKKKRYESKFSHLLSHLTGQTLTYACIPWPSADLSSVVDVLFCDLSDRKSASFNKYLRSQQVRWHPDKFTQKFGDHLHPDHVSKVMGRVKAISQILNQLRSGISRN